MQGAIAAGHPATAEAGARVLADGGNAVDACIAACFASWVAESPLSGAGGGGFMLVHRARERTTRLLDFFVAVPGLGSRRCGPAIMEELEVDFGGESTQVFRLGPGAVAVPGTVAGLEVAHRSYATLPWARLAEPALELASDGIELTRPQAYLHAILDLILRRSEEGKAIYGRDERLGPGDRLRMPELAWTLEVIAEQGARAMYDGDLARALLAGGTQITPRDLAEYRVVRRRPLRVLFRDHDVFTNAPPSSGGVLIAYGLSLLERAGAGGRAGSAEAMAALVEVMREQARARGGSFASGLYRGGLAGRLLGEAALETALARIQGVPEVGGTTHISVVDAEGNAASLSASLGSGSGVFVPGTGIQLNNMLGEYDLQATHNPRAGRRLTSMMAPTIALHAGEPRLVLGSAGSVRLRGAIMQVAVNVLAHGLPVEEAIALPRVHVEGEHVHCEGGGDRDEVERLAALGYDIIRWRRKNLYFGGVSAVEVRPDAELHAAGDPRRGGAAVVVR